MTHENKTVHLHGPDNADHEIRKAYNCVIETSVIYFNEKKPEMTVNAEETIVLYRHSFNAHRKGNLLAAERWARTTKHLCRALSSEAKLAYLEPRTSELPFLEGALSDEYQLKDRSDTTADLLNSLAEHIPPGMGEMPVEMTRYLSRARKHLQILERPGYKNELLRAERIKAAHEYGRVLECMALAYEAEASNRQAA